MGFSFSTPLGKIRVYRESTGLDVGFVVNEERASDTMKDRYGRVVRDCYRDELLLQLSSQRYYFGYLETLTHDERAYTWPDKTTRHKIDMDETAALNEDWKRIDSAGWRRRRTDWSLLAWTKIGYFWAYEKHQNEGSNASPGVCVDFIPERGKTVHLSRTEYDPQHNRMQTFIFNTESEDPIMIIHDIIGQIQFREGDWPQCKITGHTWDGCKCWDCGETRDIAHDWDGCMCTRCDKRRDEQHDWDGCKCRRCRQTGNHDWDGCECKRCYEERHEWDGCKCRLCGETGNHDWNRCVCRRCGATRHFFPWGSSTCEICGAKRVE